jgi:hypothetical protein
MSAKRERFFVFSIGLPDRPAFLPDRAVFLESCEVDLLIVPARDPGSRNRPQGQRIALITYTKHQE